MDSNLMIEAKDLNVSYEDYHALHDLLINVKPGELMGIIGPNGCGKSTLLRTINGLLKISSGDLTVNGMNVREVSLEQMAKICSNIPTEFPPDFNLNVYEVVMLGRYPHRKSMWWETAEDEAVTNKALKMFGIDHLSQRDITQLSSGERQRTLIAKAYVQQPKIMLVDEPTAHLDIRYTLEVMQYFKDLIQKEKDISIVIAAHDLNSVARFCDRITMMKKGRIIACGTPKEVITPENIEATYGVKSEVIYHNGNIVMIPLEPIHSEEISGDITAFAMESGSIQDAEIPSSSEPSSRTSVPQ